MSGIDEGPETQGQFEQFLQDEGIVDWLRESDPGEAVPDTPAETEATVAQPRDDQGRFASTKNEQEDIERLEDEGGPVPSTEEDIPADAGTDAEVESDDGDVVIEIDDDLQAVLDKYDGDVGKALKALNESQSMIGRQANEVGSLRQELAAMRQALEQGLAQRPQQYVGPYQNDIDEDPQALVMEAMERGDGRTMEMALRAWGEEDPFAASSFLFSLQQQAAQAQPAQQEPTPGYAQAGPSIEQAMSEVVQRHPDVEKYLPQVQQVAAEFPTLRDSMQSGHPQLQAQAFEELLKIAKARSQGSDTSNAMRKVILRTQEEVRQEKADAAVVSARTQSAATAKSGTDQFLELFTEATGQGLEGDWIERSNR